MPSCLSISFECMSRTGMPRLLIYQRPRPPNFVFFLNTTKPYANSAAAICGLKEPENCKQIEIEIKNLQLFCWVMGGGAVEGANFCTNPELSWLRFLYPNCVHPRPQVQDKAYCEANSCVDCRIR